MIPLGSPVDLNHEGDSFEDPFGPEIAFKYCDRGGVKILQNLELKITPPIEFNDPFEFTPRVICNSANRRLKFLLRNKAEQKDMYAEQLRAGFKGDFREFKRQLEKQRRHLTELIEPHVQDANAHLQANILSTYSRDHGVLCLSQRADSLLMWGHYCDKHRGLVIGFDRGWKWFNNRHGLREVEYVNERVTWDTSLKPGSVKELQTAERLVFCKNDDWAYERELRQLFNLKPLYKRPLGDGSLGYFLPLETSAIKTVILGLRCPDQLAAHVRSILSSEGFRHVQMWRASLHESKFLIEFERT